MPSAIGFLRLGETSISIQELALPHPRQPRIRLVTYDRSYLDKSWAWLRDPEIKALTLAGSFTKAEQQAFFDSLPQRADYKIWGVETLEGEPVGAAGIKRIVGTAGEFWCYIGERSWWGKGIGGEILELCEEKAKEFGLDMLTMIAAASNDRSIGAFEKMGFAPDPESSTATLRQLSKTVKMTIEVVRYAPELNDEWNRLVDESRNGLFLFDRSYMDYHADRFQDFSALVRVDGKVAAVFPASIDSATGAVSSHAGLTFGGLVLHREVRGSVALKAIDALLNALRAWGATSLDVKLVPAFLASYPSAEDGFGFWRRGLALVRRDLSTVLPLDHSLPFNASKRQGVAKALKSGLAVTSGSLPAFHTLLSDVLGWRHGTTPVHSLADLDKLMQAFPNQILLRSIERDGEMLAGALIYCYPTAWHTQYLASSPSGREVGALDLVIATSINEAKDAGVRWFSFGASTTDGGLSLNDGLLWQKESFGGRSVTHDFLSGPL